MGIFDKSNYIVNTGIIEQFCAVECDLGQVVCTHVPLSPSSIIWCQRKLGSEQAHRVIHWPRVHGLSALAGGVWLRATESEIGATPWAKWLGKGLVFTVLIALFGAGPAS